MVAPTLRHTNDADASVKEKIRAARALIKDDRIGEASLFLDEAARQSTAQQLTVAFRLLRFGKVSRSLEVVVCLFKAARYRKEMQRLKALCNEYANGERRSEITDTLNVLYTPLQFVNDPDATFREKMKGGRRLINEGRVREALSLVESAVGQSRHDQARAAWRLIRRRKFIRAFRTVCSVVTAEQQKAELLKFREVCLQLVRYDAERDSPVDEHVDYRVKRTGSAVTVIAFTGLDRRFTVAVYFLERLLSRFGVNTIILYDRHEAFYLLGVPELGETLQETCKSLKRLCTDMGSNHIICLGQSSGGYGALRYGLELGADHVLAFSPSFLGLLDSKTREKIASRTGTLFTEEAVDVRKLYACREKTPDLMIVYGEGNHYDKLSASALGTIRNSSVRALAGVSRHATLSEAVCNGVFFELMMSALPAVSPLSQPNASRAETDGSITAAE